MRNRARALDFGDLDEMLRYQRPAQRSRHRVSTLVERTGLQRREEIFANKLLTHVDHVCTGHPDR